MRENKKSGNGSTMSIPKALLTFMWLVAAVHPLRAAEVRLQPATTPSRRCGWRSTTSSRRTARSIRTDAIIWRGSMRSNRRCARARPRRREEFESLRREALLANPALNFDTLLVVRRKHVKPPEKTWNQGQLGLAQGLGRQGTRLAVQPRVLRVHEKAGMGQRNRDGFAPGPESRFTTVFRPPDGGWVGEIKLHWDGRRLLFTRADAENWKIWEIDADGTQLRQVSQMPADVDCMDPCYLPDGRHRVRQHGADSSGALLARSAARDEPVPHERRRDRRAAALFRPGPRPASARAAQRPGALQPVGIHGRRAHVPAAR